MIILFSGGPYFLAEIFWGTTNHESAEEHRDRGGHHHAVDSAAQPSEDNFAKKHVHQQNHSPE